MAKTYPPRAGFYYNEGSTGSRGLDLNISVKTENYEIQLNDYTILAKGSANTVAISLPTTPVEGRIYTIKCIDATFACTIDRNGKLIDGAANNLNLALNVSRTLQYIASEGWIISC